MQVCSSLIFNNGIIHCCRYITETFKIEKNLGKVTSNILYLGPVLSMATQTSPVDTEHSNPSCVASPWINDAVTCSDLAFSPRGISLSPPPSRDSHMQQPVRQSDTLLLCRNSNAHLVFGSPNPLSVVQSESTQPNEIMARRLPPIVSTTYGNGEFGGSDRNWIEDLRLPPPTVLDAGDSPRLDF